MASRFLPPYLLRQVSLARGDVADACRATLDVDDRWRADRAARSLAPGSPSVRAGATAAATGGWTVHSAGQGTSLPGDPMRRPGDGETGDLAVDEAAYGITAVLTMFEQVYGRSSYDGAGAPVSLTVHYGQNYENAFWDGSHLVFGDGDGKVFERFTKPVGVLGHEFTHAVVEHTAGLVYQGQSGALNESICDVFAACLKQRLLGQSVDDADWVIGEGLFVPGINARGLRDMAAPGTAYDDPVLGKDPQGGHLDDYVETTDDHGGVHLNSGIPNRAFQLSAVGIGGSATEGAGAIWFTALTNGSVGARTDFAGFAAATVAAAGARATVVRDAWAEVGIEVAPTRSSSSGGSERGRVPGPGAPAEEADAQVVEVRRSGGFAGRVVDGAVDLRSADPRAEELRALVERIDLRAARSGMPHPDMFVYAFTLCGAHLVVPEQHLTEDLRRVVLLVLDGS